MCTAACLAACQTADKKPAEQPVTTIEWLDSTLLHLAPVKEGQIVEVSYRFRNSGDKNLVIENVHAPCGCTVPEKPEQPFAPGQEGVIKAKFNSNGKSGDNNKTITVTANTKPSKEHQLEFSIKVTQ